MSASIRCLTCRSQAPDPGDRGHVGYPSLEDGDADGDLVSFESICRGYAALGLRLSILDEIRAWLLEHATHKVELAYEGEPVSRARRPARRGSPRLEPHLPDAYGRCFFEISCAKCGKSVRSSESTLMIPFDDELSSERIALFDERVLEVEPQNFHRTFGLLDPASTDFEAIGQFLHRHGKHRLRARSVAGESWSASAWPRLPIETPHIHGELWHSPSRVVSRASLAPPFRTAWKFQGAASAPLLVENELVYAFAGRRETVVVLDRTGSEVRRTSGFEPGSVTAVALVDGRIWLSVGRLIGQSRDLFVELWVVDPRTGSRELMGEQAPLIQTLISPSEFVGHRYRPEGREVEAVGRYVIGPPLRTVWEVEVPSEPLKGTLGWAVAFDGRHVFASLGATILAFDAGTGKELWRTDLSSHGQPWRSGNHLQVSTSGGSVVYGLQDSLHALSAETGTPIWSRAGWENGLFRAHYGDALCLAGQSVFSGQETEHLCLVLAEASGREICRTAPTSAAWRHAPLPRPRFTTVPRPTDQLIYLGDFDGRLWALSSESADPVWVHGLEGARCSVEKIVIAGDRLFACLGDGTIYCLVPSEE